MSPRERYSNSAFAATTIGHDAPRIDAVAEVTGEAQFAGDLRLHGMAYGRLLRSPYAHARITSIDTSRAEALPGVIAVMTGRVCPRPTPSTATRLKDRPILALDRVRFVGDRSSRSPRKPSDRRRGGHPHRHRHRRTLAAVTSDEALAPDAPHLHDVISLRPGLFHGLGDIRLEPGNVCYHHAFARGDVDGLFAEADIVVEGEYTFPAVYQYSLEPHTTIAQWNGDDDLTVWSSCQHPFLVRAELADLYPLAGRRGSCRSPISGGRFRQ